MAPDVKESYEVGREEDEHMPNIWLPDGVLPGFQEACLDFFWVGSTYSAHKRSVVTEQPGTAADMQ